MSRQKPIKRNFTRRRVIVNGIDEAWCSDLIEMQKFSRWNAGYRYLLMVLDVFSNYGWIVPLKDKKGETVMNAFKTIFKEGRKPQYLWTDKGKEYYNKHVKELLDKNKITLYSTENEEKSSVCERWNRTIKTKMWKQFTVQGNTQYLDMLPKLVKQYNNTKHSSIKMTPAEASKKKNGLFTLICMVIWSKYHLNQNLRLVKRSEYLSINGMCLIRAIHQIGLRKFLQLIKSNIRIQ